MLATLFLFLAVTLAWEPNTEPNLAGYKVHWGPTSGNPVSHLDVGNVLQVTLDNATLPNPAYFTKTDYCGNLVESGPSNEVIFAQVSPTPTPDPGLVNIGVTTLAPVVDSQNGNLLVAQRATLPVTAILQSMSFFVTAAAGTVRFGIYDDSGTGGGPGNKVAETEEIIPVMGWNKIDTLPTVLGSGTYWLAYFPSDNALGFLKSPSGTARFYPLPYGPLPSQFPAMPLIIQSSWSFYATFATDIPAPTPEPTPEHSPTPEPTPIPTPTPTPTPAGIFKGHFEGHLDGLFIPDP